MIIVTGGAGFIGSNVVLALLNSGRKDIIIVDDLTDGRKFQNIADLDIVDYIDYQALPSRLQTSPEFLKNVKLVIHQGACSDSSNWDGNYMLRTNYDYSKILLSVCVANDVPLIYASSAAVYGASLDFREDAGNEVPLTVYGYSKLLFDRAVTRHLSENKASQVVGLRYFNVYGPREQHKGSMASVAYQFHNQVVDTETARVFERCPDGIPMRDFVYVEDICQLILWFIEHPIINGIYNAGTGNAATFDDVANCVIEWHGKGEVECIPFPNELVGAYQSFTKADLSKLRGLGCDLEFRPVEHGVADYLDKLGLDQHAQD